MFLRATASASRRLARRTHPRPLPGLFVRVAISAGGMPHAQAGAAPDAICGTYDDVIVVTSGRGAIARPLRPVIGSHIIRFHAADRCMLP